MQLRLSQQRIVQGPRKASGSRSELSLGFRDRLDCARCEQSDPGPNAVTKRKLGCRLNGLTYEAETPVRIDYTGDPSRDYTSFCPGAYRDQAVVGYLYGAIEIESFGGLSACSKVGVYHLPERVTSFYTAALGARNRFEAEVDSAHAEVLRGA